jgi:hypothetical protein
MGDVRLYPRSRPTFAGMAFFASTLAHLGNGEAVRAQTGMEGALGNAPAGGPGTEIAFPDLAQMFRPELLALFLFDCAVVLGIAAAIVYHPVRVRARRGVRDLELPRLFLLYGLIGMAIGFLVLQNGAIIGFVVFGIGGLLRFRSVMENSTDTVEVILVTLLGLCVGLNLQNMAIVIALACWVVIWFFGRKRTYQLNLKHTGGEGLERVIARFEAFMASAGWEQDHQKRISEHSSTTAATAAATVIFSASGKEETAAVEKKISELLAGEDVEWKLK